MPIGAISGGAPIFPILAAVMKPAIHFSGLNGLRAIAALAVLFAHTTLTLGSFGLNPFVFGTNPDGNPKTTLLAGFGVSIFFVLSGFLITYLLLEEKKVGQINIKNFYIRRILRIWPLYYLYLILTVLTLLFFDMPFEAPFTLFYVFLMANVPFILVRSILFLGHYWSLGVEEQFYSFWPWIVKKSGSVLSLTVMLCVFLVLLKCIIRLVDIKTNNGEFSLFYNVINTTRFQCMLIGAIAAILYFQKHVLFLKITGHWLPQVLAWIVILLVAINQFHIASFIDNEVISLVTVFLIMGQIQKRNRIINLENRVCDFIGKISYGIYVIHPLLIFYLSKAMDLSGTGFGGYLMIYFSVFLATLSLAWISYRFFEKRFLVYKEKYSTVKSSWTMDDKPTQ